MAHHLPCNTCFNTCEYVSSPNPVSSGRSHPQGWLPTRKGNHDMSSPAVTACTNTCRETLNVPQICSREEHGLFSLATQKKRFIHISESNQVELPSMVAPVQFAVYQGPHVLYCRAATTIVQRYILARGIISFQVQALHLPL